MCAHLYTTVEIERGIHTRNTTRHVLLYAHTSVLNQQLCSKVHRWFKRQFTVTWVLTRVECNTCTFIDNLKTRFPKYVRKCLPMSVCHYLNHNQDKVTGQCAQVLAVRIGYLWPGFTRFRLSVGCFAFWWKCQLSWITSYWADISLLKAQGAW